MNNTFGMSALPQQHNIFAHTQESTHTANVTATGTNLLPSSSGTLAYLHQHPQVAQLNAHPHLTAIGGANGAPTNLFDLHKTYFTGTANARASANVTGHFFTNSEASSTQPRTLLITNGFGQQQMQSTPSQSQRSNVSTTSTADSFGGNHHINFIASPPHAPQQAHIYNINNNVAKDAEVLQQQVFQQHLLQQHNFTQSALMPQHSTQLTFSKPHYSAEPQHHGMPLANPIYIASESCVSTSEKSIPPISSASAIAPTSSEASNSTVVLDRINICINNHHYTDALPSGVGTASPVAAVQMANPTQPASPIIPAIKHKPIVTADSELIHDCSSSNESVLIIDEPDSTTTTPQTPPKTPESTTKSTAAHSLTNSPATTFEKSSFAAETSVIRETKTAAVSLNSKGDDYAKAPPEAPQPTAPLTPTTPPATAKVISFAVGDDVLIKREDNCFYLGTVVDTRSSQSYLVRFDDKSQLWCSPTEMKSFGVSKETSDDQGPMCVSCKQAQRGETVEICDRCSRGYHRSCTRETEAGNGQWLCKRCMKPMKVRNHESGIEKPRSICRQLPYHAATLNWDERHRVNEEQIYCYCGKSGQFDQDMLQCCKCKNWFHTLCLQDFKHQMWRGDGFFVFCCTVCNDGVEFVRRLQMNWVDLVHLALYNLSARHKHQHQKYHHLVQHIMPFIRKDRENFPIPQEWKKMSNSKFFEKIKETLDNNKGRFVCAREGKKDHSFYALRTKGPPVLPKYAVQPYDELSDKFLVGSLKLMLYRDNLEISTPLDKDTASDLEEEDVYNFSASEETTDDEVPITHLIDKVKKDISTTSNSTFDRLKKDVSTNSNNIKVRAAHFLSKKGETSTILSNELVHKARVSTEKTPERKALDESRVSTGKDEKGKPDAPTTSRKKLTVSTSLNKKSEIPSVANKKSADTTGSSTKVEVSTTANKKTDVPNKKSEIIAEVHKNAAVSSESNKHSEISATESLAGSKSEVSCLSTKKTEVPAASTNESINAAKSNLRSAKKEHKKQDTESKEHPKKATAIVTNTASETTDSLVTEPSNDSTSEPKLSLTPAPSVAPIMEPTQTTENVKARSRKRKLCGIRTSYKEFASEPPAKLLSYSSDENPSANRKLDKIIPEPQNFLGPNNPFRIISPKKTNMAAKKPSKPHCGGADRVKKNIFNTKRLDLTSLKSTGIYLNSSRSRFSNAAGQPRTITTYKRRLSAKDITIGPNQKVRRRRTRPQASNIEIISTQILAPMHSGFFSIGVKNPTSVEPNCNNPNSKANKSQPTSSSATMASLAAPITSKAKPTTPPKAAPTIAAKAEPVTPTPPRPAATPHHGRTLRKRPVKPSPTKSSAKTSANTLVKEETDNPTTSSSSPTPPTMQDLKQSVNKYFGAVNRIASGEEFKICGRRRLRTGEVQYLIEWGD